MNTLRCSFRPHRVSRTLRMVLNLSIPLRPRNAFIELDKTLTFSLLFIMNFLLIFQYLQYILFFIFYFFKTNHLLYKIQVVGCLFYSYWDHPMWFCVHIQYLYLLVKYYWLYDLIWWMVFNKKYRSWNKKSIY